MKYLTSEYTKHNQILKQAQSILEARSRECEQCLFEHQNIHGFDMEILAPEIQAERSGYIELLARYNAATNELAFLLPSKEEPFEQI